MSNCLPSFWQSNVTLLICRKAQCGMRSSLKTTYVAVHIISDSLYLWFVNHEKFKSDILPLQNYLFHLPESGMRPVV